MTDLERLSPVSPVGGAPIYFISRTDTTMEDARALPLADAPDGTVVLTAFQRAGRGRRTGRVWYSGYGESLMFTLIRRAVPQPQVQSLRMAVAVAEVLARRWGIDASIKWPNDVLVEGRKICGVLADFADGVLTVGCGLNLLQSAFPPELEPHATSVSRCAPGITVLPTEPLEHGLALLSTDVLGHYETLSRQWHSKLERRLHGYQALVTVRRPDGTTVEGTLAGVSADGSLLLRAEKLYHLAAGEVSFNQR